MFLTQLYIKNSLSSARETIPNGIEYIRRSIFCGTAARSYSYAPIQAETKACSSQKTRIKNLSHITFRNYMTQNLYTEKKPRVLTGDTPTGKLHLGHLVGSLENRVKMQDTHDCFFIIANYHALSTKYMDPKEIRKSVLNITLDYLAAGIDPEKSTIFVQSDVSAIHELMFILSMMISPEDLLRNPTLKAELKDKEKNSNYPFGFVLYPLGQAADILSFCPDLIPVGEDQLPHIELTRKIVRKFNSLYGNYFPLPKAIMGKEKRLIGIDPPTSDGTFRKMSKSFGNAIFLSDTSAELKKKINRIYTDPNRLTATTAGRVENNPMWTFHDVFNEDKEWVIEAKKAYTEGKISDSECKVKLFDVLDNILDPIRERRSYYEGRPNRVLEILAAGGEKAKIVADKTLHGAKELISQTFKL